ncbi:MAG TPA: hypothetical protein VGH44_03655 [Candidatus Saccharimonadia bacterium]|jgi:hypothetical protein
MTVNILPVTLDPWVPHAITSKYRLEIVKRIPRALMRTLMELNHTAQPEPVVIAEMKSPRIQSRHEDQLQRAIARAIHDLAVVWEVPLEIHVRQRPFYNDPGATILLTVESLLDPDSYGPTRGGSARYYHRTIHRLSASNLIPSWPLLASRSGGRFIKAAPTLKASACDITSTK